MKSFRSSDGVDWAVDVILPGSSNAMVVFRHPDGDSARKDRYNWVISHGPEARNVTGRLDRRKVLDGLADADVAMLFRRSMAVSRADLKAEPQRSSGYTPAASG